MSVLSVDLETYYSSEYSLSKMSEIDYILDPRFQFICASIKRDAAPTQRVWGREAVEARLRQEDWSQTALLAHNNRFDGAIIAWHLGLIPRLYLDTLSMARATTHCVIGRSSLKAVSDYLGLPPKGDEVVRAMGKRKEDFTSEEANAYMDYCDRDNDNCYDIFQIMRPAFPTSELSIIDWNLRMFIQPKVYLDSRVLAEHLAAVRSEKAQCMAAVAHIDKAVFSSSARFSALLEEHGVEVPMKVSTATGELIPALAKNDVDFRELCMDDSQPLIVQSLLAARLNSKSTIEETRTEKMLNLSLREWGDGAVGRAPIPLRYCGAHTTRFSGDGGFNWQNFKRGSRIRHAVRAPEGYVILHRDASQIEARMNASLARCLSLLTGFANGEDVYSIFASDVYGRPVTKADKGLRFVGKTSILGLGYGMGAPRFKVTLYIGNGGQSLSIPLEESQRIVNLYRSKYAEIPRLWRAGNAMVDVMMAIGRPYDGSTRPIMAAAPVIEGIDFTSDALWLPNGLPVAYPDLQRSRDVMPNGTTSDQISYRGPNHRKHLFGGKVVENICQALCRVIITNIVNRVKVETQELPFLTTHDSLDYLVPIKEAEAWDAYLDRQFAIRPAFAPLLPLASEGGWGFTLADAEAAVNPS